MRDHDIIMKTRISAPEVVGKLCYTQNNLHYFEQNLTTGEHYSLHCDCLYS